MKKLLFLCLILIAVMSCKKDEQESIPSLKLKTVTTTKSLGFDQKVTFDYDYNGNLESVKKYVGGVLQNYFEYYYEAGILTGAKSYVKSLAGNTYDLASDVKFMYANNKLIEISIHPALNLDASQPAKYSFEYIDDETPVKVILLFFNRKTIAYSFNDIMPYPIRLTNFDADYGDRWSIPNLTAAQFLYEFDHKKNPYYKLPWLDAELINNKIRYTFTPITFFHENNRTKMVATVNGSPYYTYLSTYSYSETAYPEQSTNLQSPGSSKSQTTYEYW